MALVMFGHILSELIKSSDPTSAAGVGKSSRFEPSWNAAVPAIRSASNSHYSMPPYSLWQVQSLRHGS